MIGNFYFKIPRRIRLLIIFIIIIFTAYFILRFLNAEPRNIPSDFLAARQEASLIAQDIVLLSNESTNRLNEIAQFDKDRKYTEALILISQELERNREAREKAIKLSAQLEIMAKNLAKISPASAGQIALEAISLETALISRLITYNDYLTKLLEVLREKFLEKHNGDQVSELISKINDEAKAINDLNQKFNEVMKEFDSE
ncbi:MAG: hypothetical protein Q8N28_02545 [bacterium]|nr:hypothetical protein [bacterium]